MVKTIIAYTVLSILTIAVLGGCFAGPDSRWQEPPPDRPPTPPKAGFIAGLWHGFIAIPALILGIITDIKIYECNNTGWWYDLAFLLGAGAFSGGGVHVSTSRCRKK